MATQAKKIVQLRTQFQRRSQQRKHREDRQSFPHSPRCQLLNYTSDEDHNRLVVTIVGELKL